jgi:hypothetical protein
LKAFKKIKKKKMNIESERIEQRNTEIIKEINESILTDYKNLKKELAGQKTSNVTQEILSQMIKISKATQELTNEVEIRLSDQSYDTRLIKSFETFNTPFEYVKAQYVEV